MKIPTYQNINSLLQANGNGLKSKTDEFNIRQIRVNDGAKIKNRTPHRTGFFGLTFIESGVGKIHINNESYEFEDNMFIATSPGQIITLEVKSVTNGYVIFFMPEFLNFQKPETIETQFPFFKLNAEMIMALKEDYDLPYKALFRNINIEYYKKEPEHLNIIRGYLLALLGLTNRHFLKTTGKINKSGRKYDLTTDFEKAEVYFNAHFINGKSFIDTKDKGTGLLVAKGTFIANQQENKSPVLTPLYALYIVRVDVVDKRAKLSVSLTGYDSSRVSNLKENFFPEMPIEREYPVNIHGLYKNYMAKAFYRSFKMANEIVNELEQFLISTPKNKVNW